MERKKEVYIRIKEGEKEGELKIDQVDAQHQLSLIDGIFKFFDIEVDFAEMAAIYRRSGKAYQEFYQRMDSDVSFNEEIKREKQKEEESKRISPEMFEEFYSESQEKPALSINEEALVKLEKPIEDKETTISIKAVGNTEETENATIDIPEHVYTGIKVRNGKKHYKCRYKCPNANCRHDSNHYIPTTVHKIHCYQCGTSMQVRPATSLGFVREANPELYRDETLAYYIAGNMKMTPKSSSSNQETVNS